MKKIPHGKNLKVGKALIGKVLVFDFLYLKNMMLLIGSRALKFYLSDYMADKTPNDWDFISTEKDYLAYVEKHKDSIVYIQEKRYGYTIYQHKIGPIEIEIVEKRPSTQFLYNHPLIHFTYDWSQKDWSEPYQLPYFFILLLLKKSHRFLKNSPHFLKTMRDYNRMKESMDEFDYDGTQDSLIQKWYKMREKETLDYSHPSLNQNKDDFFTDSFYVYDHDQIHAIIAIGEEPAFKKFQAEGAEVKCLQSKFLNCSFDVQLASVYEETAVLALERHQIPNDYSPDARKSFSMALMKVCTSITSGWFREFSYANYDTVIELYDQRTRDGKNYVDVFKEAVKNRKIVPLKKETG
jgi:hypothetical protein